MKAKVKYAVIISVMCLVALCSIVAIIAVFAAKTQTFNSTISVSYKATEIEGKVSANYYIGSQDKDGTAMTSNGKDDGAKELEFKGADENLNGTLNPQGEIKLTSKNNFVVFEYIFQNGLGNPVSTDYIATLTFTGTAKNIKMTTKQSEKKLADFSQIVVDVELSGDVANQGWLVLEHKEEENYIATKYFYVKVEIDSIGKDASLSGNFNWELKLLEPTPDALSFTLTKTNTYSVALSKSVIEPTDIIIPKTYTGDDGVERPVTDIAYQAFKSFNNENHIIYIPDSITSIGMRAFNNCKSIVRELILSDNVTEIGHMSFISYPIQSLTIGANVASIGNEAFYDTRDLKHIEVSDSNETFTSKMAGEECNVIIEKSSKSIILGCINSIVPTDENVTAIGSYAFYGSAIDSMVLPDNITDIASYAFSNSGLTSIKIGLNVATIGRSAFNTCNNLTEVIIDSQTVCENLISWEGASKSNLINYANTIKSKYEIAGIEGYSRNFTISDNQDSEGYWVYTHTA